MNKVVNAFKKVINFIRGVIRFIPTILGQIVFWILLIVSLLILIYVIISVMANWIADIVGIETPGVRESEDYAILSELVANGYDDVMPADELQSYYAYEYAVLMDLARNIEEAGTYMPQVNESRSIYTEFLSRDEWAQLCAMNFLLSDQIAGSPYGGFQSAISTKMGGIKDTIDAAQSAGEKVMSQGEVAVTTAVKSTFSDAGVDVGNGTIIESIVDQIMQGSDDAKPSNELSKGELIYKPVTSDTTGETALVPFLKIYRPFNIYSYSFIDKSINTSNISNISYSANGFTIGRANGNAGQLGSQLGGGLAWEYINNNIYPFEANGELNANNIALYKEGAPGSTAALDITKSYPESMRYEEKNFASVEYEIPVKVLADRFMPKAVLLSSWYLLKQNEELAPGETKTVDKILNEIKDIYNKACLDGETIPESNWLLVKDVQSVEPTTAAVDLKNTFNDRNDFGTQKALSKYAFVDAGRNDVDSTNLIYERYDPKFDSRELPNGTQQPVQPQTPQTPQTPAGQTTATPQATLLTSKEQKFTGELRDDIIDDVKLVLSHHNEEKYGFMNEAQYQKAMKDLDDILERNIDLLDAKTEKDKLKEYVLYKTDETGKDYIVNCVKLEETPVEHHIPKNPNIQGHNGRYGHEVGDACITYSNGESVHQNPYNSNASVECFVPQIKIMFARVKTDSRKKNGVETEVTVKATAVEIIDGDTKYEYRVMGKEIEDLASLSNEKTFMQFDRYDASMTNFGDWVDVSTEEPVDRTYYVVTDVLEGWPISWSTPNVYLTSAGDNSKYVLYVDKGTQYERVYEDDGEREIENLINANIELSKISEVVSNKLNEIVSNDPKLEIINSGKLAVVRNGAKNIANGEFTDDAKKPPENAAPQQPTLQGIIPGESIVLSQSYLNMKLIPEDERASKINEIERKIEEEIKKVVEDAISEFASNRRYTVYKRKYDPDDETNYTETRIDIKSRTTYTVSCSISEGNKALIYPVDERVVTLTQDVKHKEMPMYLPRHVTSWANEIKFTNTFDTTGKFDPTCTSNGGWKQLIPRSKTNMGMRDLTVNLDKRWRTGFYSPIFSSVRENDVLAMISEWERSGDRGHFAAYTYIRDLYLLIQCSKEVNNNEGKPYVDKDSYTYMYIPDEILYFDESVTDKAYWMERLLAVGAGDMITKEENYTMRNKRAVKTWQIVDYDKYDECIIKDANGNNTEVANVYCLWPMGGYLARSLYAFEANSSAKANDKIQRWGNYIAPGAHSGVDLYGRGNAWRIYDNAYDSAGNAIIKAKYNSTDGTVTLNGITISESRQQQVEIDGEGIEAPLDEADADEGEVTGQTNKGAYMNTTVPIQIGKTRIDFGGSTSAVYGYELYRLTKAYKDGEKAEKVLKEELDKEQKLHPLVATAPGIVTSVKGAASPGFIVTIDHGGDATSKYMHMRRWPEVQVGEYVGAGTIVGYEGTTGGSGGNHIHFEVGQNKEYPIPYIYPFFTPFYYEEKAEENGYELANEYLSLNRTVYPYNQIIPSEVSLAGIKYTKYDTVNPNEKIINQVDRVDGKIEIKNYVPTRPLITTNELRSEADATEKDKVKNVKNLNPINGEVNYNGDDVIAMPQYFDKEFMKEVAGNENHILISQP